MIKKDTVMDAIGIDVCVSDDMSTALDLWCRMYIDKAPWLSDTVQSAGLSASIAHEFARLVMLESSSNITGSPRADFLNQIYQKALVALRLQQLEYGLAKGALVIKPVFAGGVLSVSFVQADGFFPVEFDRNTDRVTAAAFINQKNIGDKWYTRVEFHNLSNSRLSIKNKAYESCRDDILGHEIPLTDITEWSTLAPEVYINNITQPLYAVFRVPAANTVDPASPLGVSVYSRAVNLIREADKQYSRVLWEFEGSELAIHSPAANFRKLSDGKWDIPRGRERLYRLVDGDNEKMETFSPTIRDASLINGFEKILRRIEFNCGLAYGTLSDPQAVDKTAEEIRSSKQRSYNEVFGQQQALQKSLEDLVYALDTYATLYKLAPAGKYETEFTWGDSILEDTKAEQSIRFQEASSGFIRKTDYLMWRYGVSEEDALKMLPEQQNVFEDD